MIGISLISSYLPEKRIDNMARAGSLGSTPEQIRNRIGFEQLSMKDASENTLMLAEQALKRLFEQGSVTPSDVEALVVVTQNPHRNIPHVSAELHGRFALPDHCACFDISLGCSGYVYALSILRALMVEQGIKHAVLVTADPYSTIIDPTDKNTTLLFGDGATATLLSIDAPLKIGQFLFGTQGKHADELACQNGVLYMNGRSVFNFAASMVPPHIRQIVEKHGLTLEHIDCFLVHQGSRYIVDTIADRLSIPHDKMPFLATHYGNTVSSSIPLMLEKYLNDAQCTHIVLCGFGLGFSWASTLLTRQE